MKGWKVGLCTSLALGTDGTYVYQHARTQTGLSGTHAGFDPWVPWCINAICSFVCQDHRGRAVTCLSFFIRTRVFFLLSRSPPFHSLYSIRHCLQWVQFSLMSRWSFFWISLCCWLPPLACGAFRWSQSCRPGLEGRRRKRRRSGTSLGIGDLNAPQSEPCRVHIERVILLLKLSAAPQMAFVLARDILRDRVNATEFLRLGESRRSAGKAPRAKQTEEAKHCRLGTFPPWTVERNKISGLKQRLFLFSILTNTHTHTYIRNEIKASGHPPKLRLSRAFLSDVTEDKREEMEGNMLCLHFHWKPFLRVCTIPSL